MFLIESIIYSIRYIFEYLLVTVNQECMMVTFSLREYMY